MGTSEPVLLTKLVVAVRRLNSRFSSGCWLRLFLAIMHDMTHTIVMRKPEPPPIIGKTVFFKKVDTVFSFSISSLSFFMVVVHDEDDINDSVVAKLVFGMTALVVVVVLLVVIMIRVPNMIKSQS